MYHSVRPSIAALTTAALLAAGAASAESTAVFTGVEAGDDNYTVYGGAVTALNGDINSTGATLRFSGAYGEYEYNTVAVAGGKVDIDGKSGDLMMGYQWIGEYAKTAVYIGFERRDNSLSPADPTNRTSGSENGAKVQFEVFSNSASMPGSSLIASWSTAYDTYFVRGRVGVAAGSLHVGPEAVVQGNEEFDAYKVGAFLGGINLGGSANVTLNAGYSDTKGNSSSDGAYGGVALSFQF